MFCDHCGSPILKSANSCPGCNSSFSGGPGSAPSSPWNSMHHAFVSVYPDTKMGFDQLSDFYQSGGGWPPVLAGVQQNEPESLLKAALISNFYELEYAKSIGFAERALGAAKKADLGLGRYWFAYGCALQENGRAEDSAEAYANALDLGFAEAALKLGFVILQTQFDLRSAVSTWKRGVELGSASCSQKLSTIEDEPGVYSAEVQKPDGSVEVIIYSDRPGGLGMKMSDFRK